MNRLKPFSEKPICPKCGSTDITAHWHEKTGSYSWLHRHCQLCHYEWYERTIGKEVK